MSISRWRFRTFRQLPSRVALKMRRLRFLTTRLAFRQSTLCQSVVLSVTIAVCMHLSFFLSSVSALRHNELTSPAKVSTLSGWAKALSAQLSGTSPVSCSLSGGGIRFFSILSPLRNSAFLAVGLLGELTYSQDLIGVIPFYTFEIRQL